MTINPCFNGRWKYRELLIALGRDAEIAEMVSARGLPVKAWAVTAWRRRDSIPPQYLPMVLLLAKERGLIEGVENLF